MPLKPKAPTRRDRTFHHQRAEYVENSFARHLAAGTITKDDISLLREWIDEITAQNDISVSRSNKIAFNMVSWRRQPSLDRDAGQVDRAPATADAPR